MVGNVFQQMYTVVDTAVVGKALGVGALAALGASDWLNWMMLGVIQGLTQGFGIMMAQDFGSRQMDRLRRTIGASAVLSAIGALVLLAVGQVAIAPILRLLQTPDAIQGDTVLYLRIMFGGVPVVMAYNLFAGMIRSLGDSKTPLYAMMVASCVNIGLDLLFVLVFHWGIAGAAAATLIAQVFAAGFCLWHLGKLPVLKMKREDFRLDWSQAGQLLQLGFPMAFQNAIISVGGMIVQSVVNGFGMIFIAGFTATNKLYGILEIAATSYGYAMIPLCGSESGGQEDGANPRRTACCHCFGYGDRRRHRRCYDWLWKVDCWLLYFRHAPGGGGCHPGSVPVSGHHERVPAGFVCAPRDPLLRPRHGKHHASHALRRFEFVMRTGTALLLPAVMGQAGIFYAEVLAWLGADLILVPSYFVVSRKCMKNLS